VSTTKAKPPAHGGRGRRVAQYSGTA
jgi:hypothetical protein